MEIAEFLDLAPADVLDTASFYEEYWLKPRGAHCIAVCRSIACEFCGHQELTDAVRDKLDIEPGETTDDGRFTLVELECLGACGEAPVALVDEELKKFCTPDDLVKAIDDLNG
jgi:NADH:ubiquinone oxidoreductase subunit E